MSNFTEKTKRIFQQLKLENTIWKDLDPNLLLLAFIDKTGRYKLGRDLVRYLEATYGMVNYEIFEFVGDAILHMIYTILLTELRGIKSLGDINKYRELMERNITFYCYMQQKDLCGKIITTYPVPNWKSCADIFEAMVGILFWHGYYIKGLGYSVLTDIRIWLINVWNIDITLNNLFETNQTQCKINGEFGEWSRWSRCTKSCGGGTKHRTRKCDNPLPSFGGAQCEGPKREDRSCNVRPCT